MSRSHRLFAFVAVVLGLTAWPANADDKPGKEGAAGVLAHYDPIRQALAADKLDGLKEHGEALGKVDDKEIAKAGKEIAAAKDLEGARKTFGELSKAVLAMVEAATKAGEKLGPLHVFRCPMAKPYGMWLQEVKEVGNPYYGSAMLRCGKLVDAKVNSKDQR